MLVFWLLLVGLFLVGIIFDRLKWRGSKLTYCIIAGLAMFILASVRYDVGHDYNLYGQWYLDVRKMGYGDISVLRMEKGFMIPMKLMTIAFGPDYQVMFIAIALIVSAGVMVYIYKYSEKPYLSVFCFLTFGVYFNSLNFMRQIIAAIIVMYALQYIQKKQFLRYLILVIFATCFHTSALLMIPFYFLLMIPLNWKTLGIYSFISIICFVFSRDILGIVTKYFYKGYSGGNVEVEVGVNPLYTVFFALFFIIAFLVRKELVEKNPYNSVLLGCMFFTVFFELMGVRHAILSRFSILFIIPAVTVLVPQAIMIAVEKVGGFFKGRKTTQAAASIVSFILILGLCAGMYTYMIDNDYNGVTPFRTIAVRGKETADD